MWTFAINSWTTGNTVDVLTDIRLAAACGYQHVELSDIKIERYLAEGGQLGDLRSHVVDAGMTVLSVSTLKDSTGHIGARLEELVAGCRKLCTYAEALEAPYIVVGPSHYPDTGPLPLHAVYERAVEALRRYVAVGAEHNTRIGFEFFAYDYCTIHTLARSRALLEMVDDPRLGLVLDTYQFYVGYSDPGDLTRVDPVRLFIVHVADVEHDDRTRLTNSERIMPGEGVLPLKRWLADIRASGYDGPCSLELLRPAYWETDPAIIVRRGIESMRGVVPAT
jgi:2-keto-myo-inositol isomerase